MENHTSYQLILRVRLSARYHQQRRRVYSRRARWAGYLGTVSSVGTVAAILSAWPIWSQIVLPFLISLFTLADTLFAFNAQSFQHESLYRRWLDLEAWMLNADLDNDAGIRQEAFARIVKIEADEPPENRSAVNLVDNELLRAEGHAQKYRIGLIGRIVATV